MSNKEIAGDRTSMVSQLQKDALQIVLQMIV